MQFFWVSLTKLFDWECCCIAFRQSAFLRRRERERERRRERINGCIKTNCDFNIDKNNRDHDFFHNQAALISSHIYTICPDFCSRCFTAAAAVKRWREEGKPLAVNFAPKTHTWTDRHGWVLPWPMTTPNGLPPGQARPRWASKAPGSVYTSTRERVCVLVCRQGGQRSLGGMNQPLSWVSRPLTYRACFSGTQRSTLTLSLAFRGEQGAISGPCEMPRWRSSDAASWILYIGSCFPDNYRPRHAQDWRALRSSQDQDCKYQEKSQQNRTNANQIKFAFTSMKKAIL